MALLVCPGCPAAPGTSQDPVWSHTRLLLSQKQEQSEKKRGCKATNGACSLLPSCSSGYRHGEGESYEHIGRAKQCIPPRKPVGRIFSVAIELTPTVTAPDSSGAGERHGIGTHQPGADGSRRGGPASETSHLMNYPKRSKFKPPPWCSYVELAPKSTHPKANIWLHPAGFQGRGGRAG